MKVLGAQSCLTIWDPVDCSPPDSSVHRILQARTLEWVAIPFSKGSSRPRNQTQVSRIAGGFFAVWASREITLYYIYSVQFSSVTQSCLTLRSHESQHTRPPCPSPTPRVYPNPCPLIRWCHPTISSSVIPFSSCLQSFPASGSFLMSQLFASGDQSIGASSSVSGLPMNIKDWFLLGLTSFIFLQSKGHWRVFSSTTIQKHQLFNTQLSLWSISHIFTWLLEKPQLWPNGCLLAKWCLWYSVHSLGLS